MFKIGRTSNLKQRLGHYPACELILVIQSWDTRNHEKDLLKLFRKEFVIRADYGSEYFEGDMEKMMSVMNKFIQREMAERIEVRVIKKKKVETRSVAVQTDEVVRNPPQKQQCNKCDKCGKQFASSTKYRRHCNRKKKCSEPSYIKWNDKYKCPLCDMIFNSSSSASRHVNNTCASGKSFRLKKSIRDELQSEFEDKLQEMEKLYQMHTD